MTLIELMIAMTVLAIGLPACMMMVFVGMQTNSRNKTDTTATVLDQEIVEKFATLKQYPKPTFVAIYDCALSGGFSECSQCVAGRRRCTGRERSGVVHGCERIGSRQHRLDTAGARSGHFCHTGIRDGVPDLQR